MTPGLIDSVRSFVANLIDLGQTRFELFSTELREELARLATALLGGLAVLVLAALGLAFVGLAVIFSVSEANRLAAIVGVALFVVAAAALTGWLLRRATGAKPRAFDATLSELRRDLTAIRP